MDGYSSAMNDVASSVADSMMDGIERLEQENAKLRECLEELLHDSIGEYMNSTQGKGDVDNVAIFKKAKSLLEVKDE